MTLTIKRTGAAEYGQYIKALICGEPGAGKTLISSTFPHPIYASAEGGLMSIAQRNIPYVEIKESLDLLQLKAALEQSPQVREEMFGFKIETVVIDTIDEIQKILMRERLKETRKESFELRDWGWLGDQMQAIVSGFRNLDMNVVMTCHLREDSDNESGQVWFNPGLQGAIGKQISAYFDLALLLNVRTVARVEDGQAVREQVRFLVTAPDARHQWVKDRSGQLAAEIPVNFTDDYQRISKAIFGNISALPESEEETIEDSPVANTVDQAVKAMKAVETPKPAKKAAAPKSAEELTLQQEEAPAPVAEPVVSDEPPAPTPKEAPKDALACVECGAEVVGDQADLSRIRFRKILCREHFLAAKRK